MRNENKIIGSLQRGELFDEHEGQASCLEGVSLKIN
jgi:hypothetical protein